MEQSLHTPKPYDYRQYDRIWQRVAPELEPYPGWKEQKVPALADLTSGGSAAAEADSAGTSVQAADAAPEPAGQTGTPQEVQTSGGLTLAEEAQLPGAEENPCCMGTAASEMLAVIRGFIDAELLDQRYDLALARQAPSWARGRMRELAAAAGPGPAGSWRCTISSPAAATSLSWRAAASGCSTGAPPCGSGTTRRPAVP